jgi:hypothetical protein
VPKRVSLRNPSNKGRSTRPVKSGPDIATLTIRCEM